MGAPEGAEEEGPLARRQSISAAVAVDQLMSVGQIPFDGGKGRAHTIVVRVHEAHDRDEEGGGVELIAVERLPKGPEFVAPSARLDRLADAFAGSYQSSTRSSSASSASFISTARSRAAQHMSFEWT